MKNIFSRFSLLLAVISFSQLTWAGSLTSAADLPSYYSGIDGKSGSTLWSSVQTVTATGYSTSVSYANVWTVYATTDSYMDGSTRKIYDMYGGCDFTYGPSSSGGSQCGNYSGECSCYNREHSIPKSWFGGSESANTPGSDVFHLVPTDGKINNTRSNYAFGEVATASKTHTTNGMVNKLGTAKSITIENTMLGTSSTQSCSSTPVFEPDDIYKGDFARGYFGTLLKWAGNYQAFTTDDGSSMFSGTYTEAGHWGLTPYGIALLLKWHREDPVSQKEIDRNNGIQQTQGNRNPFIDYPILAEYIWGKYAGQEFSLSNAVGSFDTDRFTPGESDGDKAATGPRISSPRGTLNFGPVNPNSSVNQVVSVKGADLESGNLTLALSGTNAGLFSLSTSSVSKANAESGYNVTITYSPTSDGNHTATLTISGCGVSSHTVTLNGTCTTSYNVYWMANGSQFHQNTAASGDAPAMPSDTPDDCSDTRVFRGWTATAGYTGDSAPDDLFTSTAPAISGETTFYAVYANASEAAGSITKSMTSFDAISGNIDDDTNVSYAAAQGSAGTAPAVNSDQIRIYQNGGLLTITANNSKKLTSITIGSAMATKVTYAVDGGSESSDQSITAGGTFTLNNINASSVVFTCTGTDKNSRLYLNSLSVTYSGGSIASYDNFSLFCTTETRTVSFNANGGSGTMADQTVSSGSATALNACTFTRSGYLFEGWATSANGDVVYADGANITTTSNIELFAKWSALKTISFNANGGSGTMADQNVASGVASPINSCTFTAPTNKQFAGWAESANGEVVYADGANITITADKVLYAKWNDLPTYTIKFMNGNITVATQTDIEGATVNVPEDPTACEGYTFEGWSTQEYAADNTASPSKVTPVTTIPTYDITYHAVYSKTVGEGGGSTTITYEKVTTAPSDWSGNYLIVYETGSVAFNGLSSAGQSTSVTISNNSIEHSSDIEKDEVVIATMDGGYSLQMNSSATNNAGKYLSGTSGSNGTNFTDDAQLNTLSISDGSVLITSNTSVLRYNSNTSGGLMFRYYKSSSYSNQQAIQLYKRTETSSGGSSTTYHTTAPDCNTCEATITVVSLDDAMGTVSIED